MRTATHSIRGTRGPRHSEQGAGMNNKSLRADPLGPAYDHNLELVANATKGGSDGR